MKSRWVFLSFVLLVSIVIHSCTSSLPGADAWKKGILTVSFDLSSSKDARAISDDFTQVAIGKVFLKQGSVVKKQIDLTINLTAKTGTGTLTDIIIGDYDIVLELYDSTSKLLYNANSTVTIIVGDNGTKNLALVKYIATVAITGTWDETITDLANATAELKQGGTVKHTMPLSLDIDAKTVNGGILNVYPGAYDLYVTVKGVGDGLKFEKTQAVTVTRGNNPISIHLDVKTGSIAITVTGDATAPAITNGPTCSVSGTTATITWTTNEPATSLVCYSETAGFNYQSSLNWAPLGGDLTADTTSHIVAISGLTEGATYYYVVVSEDESGNLRVGDEESFIALQTNITWTINTGMPTARDGLTTCTVNNLIYAIGGAHAMELQGKNTVEVFDPVENSWITKASMPSTRYGICSAQVDGKIYVFGGIRSMSALDTVEVYDTGLDTWSTKTSMPTARAYASCSSVGGIIYVFGGWNTSGTDFDIVEAYNPSNDTWTSKMAMPIAKSRFATAVINGIIYLFGGSTHPDVYHNATNAYNPMTNSWNTYAPMSTSRLGLSASEINGVIYVIGGHNETICMDLVEVYYPEIDTWISVNSMPTPRLYLSTSVADNRVFVIGGADSNNVSINVVESFAP